jgi:hypothetical protein
MSSSDFSSSSASTTNDQIGSGHDDKEGYNFNQFFVGTVSLIQEIDRRVLVVLYEANLSSGRKLYGVLRSFDQFGI